MKTIDEVMRLVREFSATGMPRRGAPIVAIGGGDAGHCRAQREPVPTRGPHARVPTTLVALIDVGIGEDRRERRRSEEPHRDDEREHNGNASTLHS